MIDEITLTEEVKIFERPIISPKSYEWVDGEVVAIILKTAKWNVDLCGKNMLDWVKMACAGVDMVVLDEPSEEDFISLITQSSKGKRIAVVLYSDTPLLSRQTILSALDYFSSHAMNAMSLSRGYIFDVEYLEKTEQIYSPGVKNLAPNEFRIIDSAQDIGYACEQLWQKIRDFHKNSGVILKGENTIFIDADVQIESGVTIEPFNVIKGSSVIEENVLLKSGNYIENSLVSSGSVLQGETIVNGQAK